MEKPKIKVVAISNDTCYNRDIEEEIEMFLETHNSSLLDITTDERGNKLIFIKVYDIIEEDDINELLLI